MSDEPEVPFVVSLSNHEWESTMLRSPFDQLRAIGVMSDE